MPPSDAPPDLATLTGVRSGKRSYYREFRRSTERLQQTIRSMDSIARALVPAVGGPRELVQEILAAAAEHLHADWALFTLLDGELIESRPRFLALHHVGSELQWLDKLGELPGYLPTTLRELRSGQYESPTAPGWVLVQVTLDARPVRALIARHGLTEEPDDADLAAVRVLANLAAVSMHSTNQRQAGLALRRQAEQLLAEVSEQARDLAVRTDELRAVEQRLVAAQQREILDAERHRIALELHDSVSQYVLSAGLAVDVCRSEAVAQGDTAELVDRLIGAKTLIGQASEQLRSLIYALHTNHGGDGDVAGLAELLHEMAQQHRPHIAVAVRIEGRPVPLAPATEHSLARTAGEALFNVTMHARATRAVVRLRYTDDQLSLSISDDGEGDPKELRRRLRLSADTANDGRHRGLANMATRAAAAGGSFSIHRARLGGVRIEVTLPYTKAAVYKAVPERPVPASDPFRAVRRTT